MYTWYSNDITIHVSLKEPTRAIVACEAFVVGESPRLMWPKELATWIESREFHKQRGRGSMSDHDPFVRVCNKDEGADLSIVAWCDYRTVVVFYKQGPVMKVRGKVKQA